MSKPQKKSKKPTKQTQETEITDERFGKIHYDPRFTGIKKNENKVKVDDRFSGVFTDERFQIVSKTDKLGRELKGKKTNKEMEEYYYQSEQEEEDEQEQEEKPKKKALKKQQQSDDKKAQQKQKKKQQKNKKQKKDESEEDEDGKPVNPFEGGFTWNEVSSSEEEIEEMVDEGDDDLWEQDKSNLKYGSETSNIIALQNYDWMHIGAKELMILFSSLCKTMGFIKSVTVYPSQFGKEQMEKENEQGPKGIWKKTTEEQNSQLEQKKKKNRPIRTVDNRIIVKADDNDCDIDIEQLRRYEKQRLMYYYAVIVCDSVKTAVHIYDNCNEQEFEKTGIPLDLRFVPNGIEFPFEPKEKCNKLPAITEVKNFTNRSLAHTNVQLTWDEPDNDKFKFLEGKDLNDEDLDKIDWNDYIGNDSDSQNSDNEDEEDEDEDIVIPEYDEEEEEANEAEYQQQISKKNKELDWRSNFDKSKNKQKNKKNKGEDMEITFMSGFGDIQQNMEKRKKEEEQEEKEGGWEKYLRKKKEKKLAKKAARKQQKENDDDYFIEPEENNDNNNEKLDKKALKQKLKKERQNLELLVDEDEDQRINDFKADVADPRFKNMYEQTDFFLDPTDKNFKKDTGSKFLDEQQRRRKQNKKVKLQ